MYTSLRSVNMIFLGLTIHYVYLFTIYHLYNIKYLLILTAKGWSKQGTYYKHLKFKIKIKNK